MNPNGSRRAKFTLGALAALFALLAPASPALALWGAGGAQHAWLLLEGKSSQFPGDSTIIYHIAANEEPGTLHRALAAPTPPSRVTAFGPRVVLLYEPKRENGEATTLRQIRTIAVVSGGMQGVHFYAPPDRLAALPGLTADGGIVDFVDSAIGISALLRLDSADGAGAATHQFLLLDGAKWRIVELPAELGRDSDLRLVATRDSLGLIEFDPSGSGDSQIWTLQSVEAPEESGDAAGAEEGPTATAPTVAAAPAAAEWSSAPTPLADPEARLVGTRYALCEVTRDERGEAVIQMPRGDRLHEVARVEDVAEEYVAMGLGDSIVLAWRRSSDEEAAASGVQLAYVSVTTGRIDFTGEAESAPPVSVNDLRFLAVLLGGVVLTVLVFVLKPRAASSKEIRLPDNTAPADTWLRLIGALIDLTPGVIVASQVWGIAPTAVLLLPFEASGPLGVWPVLTALGTMFLHSACGEALGGRTIGKLVLGMRTVSITGGAPTPWQALSRNLVKMLAPPLVLLIPMDPLRRHPGDIVAGTIVVTRKPDRGRGEEQPTGEKG
ncbi:MAG: RDD family protein [Planctomycetota bacterium]|nr:RDD family protein [Planctomycetota bacterium]